MLHIKITILDTAIKRGLIIIKCFYFKIYLEQKEVDAYFFSAGAHVVNRTLALNR